MVSQCWEYLNGDRMYMCKFWGFPSGDNSSWGILPQHYLVSQPIRPWLGKFIHHPPSKDLWWFAWEVVTGKLPCNTWAVFWRVISLLMYNFIMKAFLIIWKNDMNCFCILGHAFILYYCEQTALVSEILIWKKVHTSVQPCCKRTKCIFLQFPKKFLLEAWEQIFLRHGSKLIPSSEFWRSWQSI